MAEYPRWKRETVDPIEDARPIVDLLGLNTPKLLGSPPVKSDRSWRSSDTATSFYEPRFAQSMAPSSGCTRGISSKGLGFPVLRCARHTTALVL